MGPDVDLVVMARQQAVGAEIEALLLGVGMDAIGKRTLIPRLN
jgi:hypothetical protein